MIRVVLPYHLRNLAHVDGEVQLEVKSPATVRSFTKRPELESGVALRFPPQSKTSS